MTSKEIAELKSRFENANPLSNPVLILEIAYQLAVANELKREEMDRSRPKITRLPHLDPLSGQELSSKEYDRGYVDGLQKGLDTFKKTFMQTLEEVSTSPELKKEIMILLALREGPKQ